jgi:hypothetical protein
MLNSRKYNLTTVLPIVFFAMLLSCNGTQLDTETKKVKDVKNQLSQKEADWKRYAGSYTYHIIDIWPFLRKITLSDAGDFRIQQFPSDEEFQGGKGKWLISKDDFGATILLLKFDGHSSASTFLIAEDKFIEMLDQKLKNSGLPGIDYTDSNSTSQENEVSVWIQHENGVIQKGMFGVGEVLSGEAIYSVENVDALWSSSRTND